jgi:hypothetical protein
LVAGARFGLADVDVMSVTSRHCSIPAKGHTGIEPV